MTTALRTNQILDQLGRPVPSAQVYVYNTDAASSLAALTNGTTSIANPVITDAFGNYSYYAVVNYYREDVWFNGAKRWSENNVAVGAVITTPSGSSAATRSILANIATPLSGQSAVLTEAGREGSFVFDSANHAADVTADPQQGVYIPPSTDSTGASGAWVRKGTITPFMFGAKGDQITNDAAAYQAFNDWFFAQTGRPRADASGNFLINSKVFTGPATATDQTGIRYNISGRLNLIAGAALTEIHELRNIAGCDLSGLSITTYGTGGVAYASRTCGIGTVLNNCTASHLGGLRSFYTQYHGIYPKSDGTHFNDDMAIDYVMVWYAGSSVNTSGLALTANWSAPTNTGSSGDTTQRTVLTVTALPPVLIDAYGSYGVAVINGEPYQILSVDRINSKITIYRWLDSAQIAIGSGSLVYNFGGSFAPQGGDSGVIHVGKLFAIDCGIGAFEGQLYGSSFDSVNITSCGIAVLTGSGTTNAHIGSTFKSLYMEGNTFQEVNQGVIGASGYNHILSSYSFDPSKCWNIADPRLSNDNFGLNGGSFGSAGSGSGIVVADNGRMNAWHQRSLHNPVAGSISFIGQNQAPAMFSFPLNSGTVVLSNQTNGARHVMFGYWGGLLIFVGTGTNNSPTGTFPVTLPTRAIANCVTNSTTTVAMADTRGLIAGMPITGSGIPASTTIASITNRTTIVLSQSATASATVTLTVTGRVNGSFTAPTFSGPFDGPVVFLTQHIDIYENDWVMRPISGQSRVNLTPLGYGVGAGGTVTQLTSKATAVTLNTFSGAITMNNAALAAGAVVSFTLNDSNIGVDDVVDVRLRSGFATAATYKAWAEGNASGSRTIILQNISAGSLSEAVVVGFVVIKGSSS